MRHAGHRFPNARGALLPACLASCLLAWGAARRPAASAPPGGPDGAPQPPAARRSTPPAQIAGAVASGHASASAAGLSMLAAGGNAVDAAVATALAQAVVYPEAGNLGGGGFAVVKMGDDVRALDFRETAPAAASRDMYLDAAGHPRADAAKVGPLAAGVPGSPAGLYELHHALGRLPWAQVVAPAIRLARQGCPVDAHLHALLAADAQRHMLASFPQSAERWLPGGQPPPQGANVQLPELAATLEDYARRGPAAIVQGRVAEAVAAASRRHGGVLEAGDLAAYRPQWRQPVRFSAFGWQVASMPLPSAGGILIGQTCGMLEGLHWADLPAGGADRPHLLIEAFRRAFADRMLLADPAASRATVADLLDPRWIATRAAGIDPRRATASAALAPWPAGNATVGRRGGETTHLSAIDGDGNTVALTTTLNGLFGCGLFVPQLGFLNNEMGDFAIAPAAAAGVAVAAAQASPNGVAPGKRMLSSMAPTIAWREQEVIALGGRGSMRIPTNVVQVLLAVLVDHAGLQAAVDRPRLHAQPPQDPAQGGHTQAAGSAPAAPAADRVEVEPGALSAAVQQELTRRGHHLVPPGIGEQARVNAVQRLADGSFAAAVDQRGDTALDGARVLAPPPAPHAGSASPSAAAHPPAAPSPAADTFPRNPR